MYNKKMKINRPDFERLAKLINATLEKNPTAREQYKQKGLSATRFLWDTWHYTVSINQRENVEDYLWLRGLQDYLNDNHLETALKNIVGS